MPLSTITNPFLDPAGAARSNVYSPAANTIGIVTSGTERVRVDSSGNLGVGINTVTTSGSRRVIQVANGASGGMLILGNSATENGSPRLFLESTYDLGLASGVTTGVMKFYTNDVARMTVDASGRVLQPFQPAFAAYGSGVGSHTRSTASGLPFTITQTNVGSNFNTSNYRFTAPVTAVYFMTVTMRWENNNSAAGYWSPVPYVNGVEFGRYTGGLTWVPVSSYSFSTISFVITLTSGDYMTVSYRTNGDNSNKINMDETIWSGYLLG